MALGRALIISRDGAMAFLIFVFTIIASTLQPSYCDQSLVPALFVFGDSSADTGNNKYIEAAKDKADFLPYGRDLVPPRATGRFSNGKLVSDYLAEFLKLPSPIEFYDPEATGQRLLQGVNFASAGSGILDQTGNTSGSISLSQQIRNYVLAHANISQLIGPTNTSKLIKSSIFLISSGNNDIGQYIQNSLTINNKDELLSSLTSNIIKFIQTLYNIGARKIVLISPSPLGCAPFALTMFNSTDGHCIKRINSLVNDTISSLASNISMLASQLGEATIEFGNTNALMLKTINDPTESGFEYVDKACCGDGIYGADSHCSPSSFVCSDASKYIYWDFIHPTQALYQLAMETLLFGSQSLISPFNISQLVLL